MKLAAAHQPTGYVRRLQQRALSRKMGSQIPRDGNKDVPALVAVAPLVKLPHAGLEHLVGMEARISVLEPVPVFQGRLNTVVIATCRRSALTAPIFASQRQSHRHRFVKRTNLVNAEPAYMAIAPPSK
jgi:hypothetical protein